LWKRRFGGNPNIVGTSIQLDGQPYLVVGVIGRTFATESGGDLWLPYQFDPTSQDMANYFFVAARLKPGITLQMANARLKIAAEQYRNTYPNALGPQGSFGAISLQQSIIGDTRSGRAVSKSSGNCLRRAWCSRLPAAYSALSLALSEFDCSWRSVPVASHGS